MRKLILMAMALLAWPALACAQATQPSLALSTTTEGGKPTVNASVKLNGKPLENITLQFYAVRSFGNVLLGEDTTLDDGSAAVDFPTGLPGSADGQLHVFVKVKAPPQFADAASAAALFPSNVQPPKEDPFPRALWAPQAPLLLMGTIIVLVAGVWLCYAFVIGQIVAIRRGAKQ